MESSEPVSEAVKPGFALWLTGLPASGKSALAGALHAKLAALAIPSVIVDSDDMRRILTPHPNYSAEERDAFYGTLAKLAEWLTQSGVNVLIAATAHRRQYRDEARRRIPRFAEIYVNCSVELCRARDPKQLYAQSAAGIIDALPGAGNDYEAPLNPEVVVTTDSLTVDQAAVFVLKQLRRSARHQNGIL